MAIATDRIDRHGHPAHALLHGYVQAVADVAGALPLALPAAANALDAATLIESIDGVVSTGSPSNVAPERYRAPGLPESVLLDRERDDAVLSLLPRLVAAGVPVLGVCRGFQEMNVAWGGTLDAAVHARPGGWTTAKATTAVRSSAGMKKPLDRRRAGRAARSIDGRAAPAGQFAAPPRRRPSRQRTSPRSHRADGLVEAFSVEGAAGFALGVQWHPEMRTHDCPLARAIFTAFGEACRKRRSLRLAAAPHVSP